MEAKDQSKRDFKMGFFVCAIIIVLLIVALVIMFLLRGRTTISTNDANLLLTQSLTCEKDGIDYPFFMNDNATKKSIKIVASFSDDRLSDISFIYRLSYSSNAEAVESEARNHAALGTSFGDDRLDVDAFNANFSILENDMQLSLYAYAKEIGALESKYFLLENTNGVYKIDNLAKIYTSRGLDCVTKRIKD